MNIMPRLINLGSQNTTEKTTMKIERDLSLNNITMTYENEIKFNRSFLKDTFPGKILFSLKETAGILCVSYELIRVSVNCCKIPCTTIGGRKFIHINILSELITRGI